MTMDTFQELNVFLSMRVPKLTPILQQKTHNTSIGHGCNFIKNKKLLLSLLIQFCSFVSSCTRQHSLSIFPLQSTINALRCLFHLYGTKFHLALHDHNTFCCAVKRGFFWCCIICFGVCLPVCVCCIYPLI